MIRRSLIDSGTGWLSIGLSIGMLSLCGCSDTKNRRHAVAGQVTLDGQPVQDATIIFTPKGEGLAAAASIVDGSFCLTDENGPTQGAFDVRINPKEAELQEVEGRPAQLPRANRRPRIPGAYQRDGKLTATITGQAGQSLSFELFTREPR